MNKKLDLTNILKDCLKGMELDCTMFDNVRFERLYKNVDYPIVISVGKTDINRLTKEGCWNKYPNAKCVIFPRGKTSWEGFQRPFIDGDIVYNRLQDTIGILVYDKNNFPCKICDVSKKGVLWYNEGSLIAIVERDYRFATEDEKFKLFQAIKDNGYKWNEKTKNLEKLELTYPKTYAECCDMLKIPNDERYIDIDVPLDYNKLLSAFTKILICRDAYWKIAGEQMRLGKPWEPCDIKDKYVIFRAKDEILKGYNISCILEFPTVEMRDTFFENFKDLIEQCKKLL